MNSTSTSTGGIGFSGMLAILFIGLKLTGHITWPWLWVLSPIWITGIGTVLTMGIAFYIYRRDENKKKRRRHKHD